MTVNLSVAGPRSISMEKAADEEENDKENDLPDQKEMYGERKESEEPARIIPWRAQLRKTNSKLNLLE